MKTTRFVLALVSAFAFAACQPTRAQPACEDGAVVDTDVMAFLSKARAAHHQANLQENEGKLEGAIAPLEELVRSPLPRPGTRVPEIEEVLADTYARIADLKTQLGDYDGADKDALEGLTHAPSSSYYRGHLLEVEGITEEQRAAKLKDAGKSDEAARASERAVQLLKQAVDIQNEFIKKTTGKEGGP